ncbi:MAG: hypothetical protein Ct9H300mP12_07940 [Acidimicrobiales bacterium]|nr:MAG: hypothetical protein Ct9H300mP12_07940 [Acidimicrobiales bacterium]
MPDEGTISWREVLVETEPRVWVGSGHDRHSGPGGTLDREEASGSTSVAELDVLATVGAWPITTPWWNAVWG